MKWLRKLMGLDFPHPVAGQVWRCRRNGEEFRVARVELDCMGTVHVAVQYEARFSELQQWNPIATNYCTGLATWRRALRAEARELVTEFEERAVWPT